MAITLTNAGTLVSLSDRLVWTDEFAWSPVVQKASWSLAGALLLDVGQKQAGRPITLEGRESAAWITRGLCATLRTWASAPGLELVLQLRGLSLDVIFDHERGGLDASPIWNLLDGEESASQLYIPTLRFLTL